MGDDTDDDYDVDAGRLHRNIIIGIISKKFEKKKQFRVEFIDGNHPRYVNQRNEICRKQFDEVSKAQNCNSKQF